VPSAPAGRHDRAPGGPSQAPPGGRGPAPKRSSFDNPALLAVGRTRPAPERRRETDAGERPVPGRGDGEPVRLLRRERAEADYQHAVALASDIGMRPLVAHCHLGLGKLYRRTGKHEQAHEHLTTALTMYREMDMRFWLETAEAEMGGLA
jgi:tetratricopeptide (TPR) repeat protein